VVLINGLGWPEVYRTPDVRCTTAVAPPCAGDDECADDDACTADVCDNVRGCVSTLPRPDDEFVLPNLLSRAENTYPLPILLNTSPTSPLFRKRTNGSRVESCCHSYSVDSPICCAISLP